MTIDYNSVLSDLFCYIPGQVRYGDFYFLTINIHINNYILIIKSDIVGQVLYCDINTGCHIVMYV